jgi:uncharacterized protein YchJ
VDDDRRTSVERLIARTIDEPGMPLSERARLSRRSVESYLKAGARPRWMERLQEVDRAIDRETRRLEQAHHALRDECGDDAARFAARWREHARGREYDELNELIRQHNEWYPIERDLPMNPRTGEYVGIGGRSHRRPELTPEWVLRRFPAD